MKIYILSMMIFVVVIITSCLVIDEPLRVSTCQASEGLISRSMVFSTVESGYIEVNGGRIFYEAAGQGPAIVMIHDGLLHRETWDGQFAEFAKRYRVIRSDRRGYGRSDTPKMPFSYLDDLLAVMKAHKVERAWLMGCSAGGMLAIHFALDHPEMVSGLVLVGPIVSGFGFSDHFTTRGGRGMPNDDAPVGQRIEYWTSKDPWIMAPESLAAKQKMKALLTANPQNLRIPWQLIRWPDTPALGRLSQIKVPTLIVVGESDIPDVHAHIGAIQAGIADSKRVVVTHSGHLPHMEVSSAFNQVVLDFLQSIK
ncbi:MAG: alpha/beta hydrolase [Acidobacteria bacterium]|nr:alpha/beta hydrolase [Acidobacteriota bacterium]